MTINELITLNNPKVNILLDKYFKDLNNLPYKEGDYVYDIVNRGYRKVKKIETVNINSIPDIKIKCYNDHAIYSKGFFESISMHEGSVLDSYWIDDSPFISLNNYNIIKMEYETSLPF